MRTRRFFLTNNRNAGAGGTAALLISAALLCFPAWGAVSEFHTIDFPGAARTIAFDVNSRGDVVGVYMATCTATGCSAAHGFIWKNGAEAPESVDVSGASLTRVFGINDAVTSSRLQGRHDLERLRAPRRIQRVHRCPLHRRHGHRHEVRPAGHRRAGNAVGSFDAAAKLYGQTHTLGFIWNDGALREVEAPFESTYITILRGMDARGEMVGCYWTYAPSGNTMHSLAVTSAESFRSEDFPGSKMSMNWRTSASGFRVGHYLDFDGTTHGYVLNDGEYERVDYPGAVFTDTRGVADVATSRRDDDEKSHACLLVGSYIDKASKTHGYLATGHIRTERDRDRHQGPDIKGPGDGDAPQP